MFRKIATQVSKQVSKNVSTKGIMSGLGCAVTSVATLSYLNHLNNNSSVESQPTKHRLFDRQSDLNNQNFTVPHEYKKIKF